jgi:uncharacterized membrane protein YeaQ/YmgE (transglycosylase-associated protein family)
MLGMNFASFLVLLVIGSAMALLYQYGFRYRFVEGIDSLVGKIALGWIGAWLGSPVLGHWFWEVQGVYIIPAILGSAAVIHLSVLWWKAAAKVNESRLAASGEQRTSGLRTAA